MTRPRTPARDLSTLDQVAAALRDAGSPITERDLRSTGAGSFLDYRLNLPRQLQPGEPGHNGGAYGWEPDHYHECWDAGCVRSVTGSVLIWAVLERLVRQGLAERTKVGRSVYWSWTGPTVDMTAFEEQMSI